MKKRILIILVSLVCLPLPSTLIIAENSQEQERLTEENPSAAVSSKVLDRYLYVAMPSPISKSGDDIRDLVRNHILQLFQNRDITVLGDYASIDRLLPEDRCQVLELVFEFSQRSGISSVLIHLYDCAGQKVFHSSGTCSFDRGGVDDLKAAAGVAVETFWECRREFDPNLAAEYTRDLESKFKDWERVDINEASLREYLSKNSTVGTLDPIEGVWMRDRYPHIRTGILKDTKAAGGSFIQVRLDQGTPFWKPGHLYGRFEKTALVGTYVATMIDKDQSSRIADAKLSFDKTLLTVTYKNANQKLDFIVPNLKKLDFIKLYPHSGTAVSDFEVAPPRVAQQGTGFAVSSDGCVVTAYHVVKGAKIIKVYFTKDSFVSAKVIHGDPINDLAVLKIEKSTPNFLQIAPMRSVKTGDRVFTLGFPVSSVLGREAKYTEGVVSSLSGLKDASSFLQITVPVQPGNSGGALVNERGEVVGVITSSAAILPFIENSGMLPQNVNWAVKADYLRPLVEFPKVEQKEFNREQLINHVKNATFLIETE